MTCMRCGKSVSTNIPDDTVIRAWIECPECLEKTKGKVVADLSGKISGTDEEIAGYLGVPVEFVTEARATEAETFQDLYDFIKANHGLIPPELIESDKKEPLPES